MLVELSIMEQRYHAVMEVVSGAPVSEVGRRYGVSRQTVHGWLGRYEHDGLAGLADRSHRPRYQPRQLDAEVEALICQLRGAHPRWGPRRLLYELGKARVSPLPSRSTIYRVLVRHGLVPDASASAAARTTSAGSVRSPCSCGSWMSPGRCSWPMAPS
jgi:transposase